MDGFIFAFDPGYCSGLCIARHNTGKQFIVIKSVDILWSNRFSIYHLITANAPMIKQIVIEEFRLFNNPKTIGSQIHSTFPSVSIISIIELSAHLAEIDHLITMQSPGNIHYKDSETHKTKATLSIEDEHRELIKGSIHRVDAYLHLKYFILMNKRKDVL